MTAVHVVTKRDMHSKTFVVPKSDAQGRFHNSNLQWEGERFLLPRKFSYVISIGFESDLGDEYFHCICSIRNESNII